MKRNAPSSNGHSHSHQPLNTEKSQAAVAERKARRARKVLSKLFPYLARRLHKGVRFASVHQHALTLSQSPPFAARVKAGKYTGTHKAA